MMGCIRKRMANSSSKVHSLSVTSVTISQGAHPVWGFRVQDRHRRTGACAMESHQNGLGTGAQDIGEAERWVC